MADVDLIAWTLRLSRALRDANVKHAIAGGLAVAAHGRARATTDIDLVIEADAGAIARARAAAASIGALQTKRPIAQFKHIGLLRVILAPEGAAEPIPIDLLVPPAAIATSLFERALATPFGDGDTWLVSVEDLIALKMLRGSAVDIEDVRELASKHALDRAYLARVAKALRITARVTKALTPASPRTRARSTRGRSDRRRRR
jgi:hypothetical protein